MTKEFELLDNRIIQDLDIRLLINSYKVLNGYTIVDCSPAKGILFITEDNPGFISGHVRMRGRSEGRYPFNYLEMIDNIFGYESNIIEVCSRSVPGINMGGCCFTVDTNPDYNPDLVTDGQTLDGIHNNRFKRYRCDPPYNKSTAKIMYGTSIPIVKKLLRAGARVCKPGSLMFLLLGPKNYQPCPPGVKRIGLVLISVVPNNELRALNVSYKVSEYESLPQKTA